jgi:hypothetical protein
VLQRVELFSSNPSAPELPLGGFMASDDPVQVRSIDGLGPVKAEVASTEFATGRGELLQGSSVGKRNIVMTLGLNPDWAEQTMSNLRQKLYRYLLPQAWTKLRFFSDYLPVVDIEGIVESFEPNIFSQDPEIQVSILCHKPDFIEADAITYEGVVDDGTVELEFDYIGTQPTGLELRIDRTVANPSYFGDISVTLKSPVDPQIFVAEAVTVDTLKYFKLSSVPNAKRVQSIAVADGAITNLLGKMTTDSVWPEIRPGTNALSVACAENGQKWSMAYFNRFGGL